MRESQRSHDIQQLNGHTHKGHVLSGCNAAWCEKVLFVLKSYQNREKNRAMSILSYFKASPLPTPKETGIGASATKAVNQVVSHVLSLVNKPVKKQKVYIAFINQQQAAIGKYTAECGNAAAL